MFEAWVLKLWYIEEIFKYEYLYPEIKYSTNHICIIALKYL